MRLILGVIFGILIVFNWTSIKTMFDSSLAEQAKSLEKTDPNTPVQLAPPTPPQMPQSLSGSVEQRLKDAATSRD